MKAQPDTLAGSPVARYYRANDPKWHWLEARDSPDVSAFLEAANQQQAQWFAPLTPLAERSIKAILRAVSLPSPALRQRLTTLRSISQTGADAITLAGRVSRNGNRHSVNVFLMFKPVQRMKNFMTWAMALSPDEQWLAWTEDTQGDERYTLCIKSLPSGEPVSAQRYWRGLMLG